GNGESTRRYYFTYPQPVAGEGHFIHTYRCDGSPIPSFEGEPVKVAIPNDKTEFENLLWNSLNADNKVSLFVRYIDLATGKPSDTIINKYNRI
ncbi:MAG: IMP cyclohydrolase, partial [Angelakisella sp.]